MTNTRGHIAIVGAGLIGRAWTVAFARGGYAVRMYDPVEGAAAKSHDAIPPMLQEMASHDLLNGQTPEQIVARVTVAATLADAMAGAIYVQESGPENRDTKAAIYTQMDEHCGPDTVLASSTSIILPSLFTGHITHKANCLVAHPLNPPHLIPAIEIVPAPWTAKETLARAKDILVSIGQKPVVMMKEIDGFLMNRLQGALLEECFRLLEGGYATAEDIDMSLKEGLAMRWSFIGPFETADLNAPGGIRDYIERFSAGYGKIQATARERADWTGKAMELVEKERRAALPLADLRKRQDWRDRQLMRLAAFRKAQKD
ncbi:MAG: 3-hydroxyacyl-CoA dehydrogenase [Hyphomicrobiales bacterium]